MEKVINKEIVGDDQEKILIVIGRQYGSGGRRIGKLLARELGISYYDKTLMSEAAGSLGYSAEIFNRADEKRPSLLRSLLSFNYGASTSDLTATPMSDEELYRFQSQVIREICQRESCVIVGRTADYVMRDHPRMASIFVHAPIECRAKALVERGEAADEKEGADIASRRDKSRASYYNYYTNRNGWGRSENYHLSFDSSRLSDEAILTAVTSLLKLR